MKNINYLIILTSFLISLNSCDKNDDEIAENKNVEQYVIYADNCLLPKEFMAKKNIIFKKIPRDITRF